MSATELERRVTDLLNRRAEEAMNTVDIDERLEELLEETRAEDRRRGRRVLVGAVAATAAVTVVVFWAATRGDDQAELQPAEPISPQQVATGYVDALASYDLPAAESYLSADPDLRLWDGVPTDLAGWRAAQAWNEAIGFEMHPGTCRASDATVNSATSGTFACPYVFEGLGSQELGLGPYKGSTYQVTVEDGAVVATSDDFAYATNGYSGEIWEPFTAWVTENYPRDVDVMYTDGGATQATTDRSNTLWQQHLDQYVAAKLGEQQG
jgi:hypothetical protein